MLRTAFPIIALAAAALACNVAFAQQASPAGLWKTIDDHTGKPASLVRITEHNGEFEGKIEKLFRAPDEEADPKCDKCEGMRKDQPVVGMTILTGMKQDGDHYDGGHILDPANGKVYHATMSLEDGGRKLDMRGYIGIPLIGRTQTWLREE